MANCPHCGKRMAQPKRKYATAEERQAAVNAQARAAADKRALADMETIWPQLPEVFTRSTVGHLMHASGRHWGESEAVINRWSARGWIVALPAIETAHARIAKQWKKAV